jgi:hypothetical protein
VLLHYDVLLGVVANQKARSKNQGPQAQMGNLMANIRLPHSGSTGVDSPLLGPKPWLIFALIYLPFFLVVVGHKVLLLTISAWKACR